MGTRPQGARQKHNLRNSVRGPTVTTHTHRRYEHLGFLGAPLLRRVFTTRLRPFFTGPLPFSLQVSHPPPTNRHHRPYVVRWVGVLFSLHPVDLLQLVHVQRSLFTFLSPKTKIYRSFYVLPGYWALGVRCTQDQLPRTFALPVFAPLPMSLTQRGELEQAREGTITREEGRENERVKERRVRSEEQGKTVKKERKRQRRKEDEKVTFWASWVCGEKWCDGFHEPSLTTPTNCTTTERTQKKKKQGTSTNLTPR